MANSTDRSEKKAFQCGCWVPCTYTHAHKCTSVFGFPSHAQIAIQEHARIAVSVNIYAKRGAFMTTCHEHKLLRLI